MLIRNEVDGVRLVVQSFAMVIIIGALLLFTPWSAADPAGHPVSWLDALFTSTSAVCVTGLVTLDTGQDFSFLGQAVILALIQVGGLGFLTFTNFFIAIQGGRLDFMRRAMLATTHGTLPGEVHPGALLRHIVLFTFALEGVGAVLLTGRFALEMPFTEALWMGIFYSISAFCNAGFGLLSDSLMPYRDDPLVNLTIMGLIVTGGLGFVVFTDLSHRLVLWRRGQPGRLSLHSRMVLIMTGILVPLGTVLFFLLEQGGTAAGENGVSSALSALFLSITSRTAGFNTIDTARLTAPTLYLVILFMAVGGSPGSTAGGMKTTTVGIMAAMLMSRLRNREGVEFLDRTIPAQAVLTAMLTFAAFAVLAVAGFLALLISETGLQAYDPAHDRSLALLFETVSALATVGLSTGVTAGLSAIGKVIIIVLMFVGRLGPLVLGLTLMGRRPRERYKLPDESVNVG
ncbi:cation transporter [Magnetococcus marinus MC-1]|uniref:Cation transporter n=1 Tax=Magnetococcus marinus (strain ATCC BAA-1437 / JCM 17883 / MC-1) TaxID=156889 RepID=A0LDP4_MAGMM|nr:cation transporter [Magnetococcus marinus MC-1]